MTGVTRRVPLTVILLVLTATLGFAQIFPEEEYLSVVELVDGSALTGRIVEDAASEEAVVVEIYGGSRFVIAVENVVEITTVPNGDYGKGATEYTVPEAVLAEALGMELPDADGDGERSRRLEIQAAGGTIVSGGVTFPFRDGSFEFTLLGGIGNARGIKAALAQRLTWTMPERRVAPRVSVYAVEVTDLSDIGIAWGPSVGVAFKLRRFASAIVFDNAFVVNFRPYEPEYMVYMPSIGVQF